MHRLVQPRVERRREALGSAVERQLATRRELLCFASAQEVARCVGGDRVKPGPEAGVLPKSPPRANDREEGGLSEIFGAAAPDQPNEEGVDRSLIPTEKRVERLCVALAERHHQRLVGN